MASSDSLTFAVKNLNLTPTKPTTKSKVVESWDDESDSEGASPLSNHNDQASTTPLSSPQTSTLPKAPPPTPANKPLSVRKPPSIFQSDVNPPIYYPSSDDPSPSSPFSNQIRNDKDEETKRPEKSTVVLSRLIAAGLGVRVPKRTEEQKAYDKAIRERERKKKEDEIVEKKKAERAKEDGKRAVWED